ncbi:MAG: ComEC/Rec2 family competence protein [Patescibacteria group bacterium]
MAKILLIVIGLLGILIFRFFYFAPSQPDYPVDQRVLFVATVNQTPEIKEGKQLVRVLLSDGKPIRIVAPVLPVFSYGDRLSIQGKLQKSEYAGRVFWSLYYPQITLLGKDDRPFMQAAVAIKGKAQNLFQSTLPPIPASLLAGMLFGGRHGMPESFMADLQATGVLHVIAASGANVSFVAGALLGILGRCLRRQYALILGLGGIAFYAFLAGFEPSIVRAAIMGSVAFGAALLGRQNDSIVALLFTGYVMLFHDPQVFFDLGFQLSFMATLGIIIMKPVLDCVILVRKSHPGSDSGQVRSSLARMTFLKSLREDMSTTLAAQITTTPLLLGTFGQVSLWSVIANVVILWTIPIVMVFGAVGLVVGILFEPVGKGIVLLSLPFLLLFQWVVAFFGSLGTMFTISSFPIALGVGYYLLIGMLILFARRRLKNATAKKVKSLRDEIGV